MNNKKNKIKGETLAKIIWIISTVFIFMMTIGIILDFVNEVTFNSLCEFIKMLLYLVAYIIGIFYLFKNKNNKLVILSSSIYALTTILSFVFDICCGSKYGVMDLIYKIFNVIVFIISAITIMIFTRKDESKLNTMCLKFWWIPYIISILLALIESIITEINDIHGFDISLVVLDIAVAIIILLPMFSMNLFVKNKCFNKKI